MHPSILAIGTSTPKNRFSQQQIYDLTASFSEFYRSDRVRDIFMNSDIDYRSFMFDIGEFRPDESRDALHERFLKGSMEIGSAAIRKCLEGANLDGSEIDCFVVVSCTGYLCPGLSSLLARELGLRTDLQRADILGMGCAGAMPGLQRAHDFVRAYPERKALLLAVEICSACHYFDESLETVVGNAICADGAAAAVIGMSDSPAVPKIEGFDTLLEPSLIGAVGLEHRDGRLRIILSKDIRQTAGVLADRLVGSLLGRHRLAKKDIRHWIFHSGGRKVIDSIRDEIGLADEDLRHSAFVLRNFGNMSSPTVLFVLAEAIASARPRPGDLGVALALGPGLAVEAALLSW